MIVKVGVLQFFSWPGRRGPLQDVYGRALERIGIMDRGGFDARSTIRECRDRAATRSKAHGL